MGIIWPAYKNGIASVLTRKKMLFWIYAFNLLSAYILALPMSMILSNAMYKSSAAGEMLEKFDFSIFSTIMADYARGTDFVRLTITLGLLYVILNVFFAGGILKIFIEQKKFNLTVFFAGCATYFSRFLRLLLMSLIFFLTLLLVNALLSAISGFITKNAASEQWLVILFLLRLIIIGLALAFVNMLFDYARILTVVNDYNSAIQALKDAIIFVFSSLLTTSGLYLLYLLTTLLFIIFYLIIEGALPISSAWSVLFFFFLTQLVMIARAWIRLSYYAGQSLFYQATARLMPAAIKEIQDENVG
jgi:hypothetical protein